MVEQYNKIKKHLEISDEAMFGAMFVIGGIGLIILLLLLFAPKVLLVLFIIVISIILAIAIIFGIGWLALVVFQKLSEHMIEKSKDK